MKPRILAIMAAGLLVSADKPTEKPVAFEVVAAGDTIEVRAADFRARAVRFQYDDAGKRLTFEGTQDIPVTLRRLGPSGGTNRVTARKIVYRARDGVFQTVNVVSITSD
jgi:hypothetical protein